MNNKTNPLIKTAIIYSLDHLYAYTVEIREKDKSYYLSDDGLEPKQFGNMEDVRHAIVKEHVKKAYLALSNTSEETDLTTCHANHDHFEYSSVVLEDE